MISLTPIRELNITAAAEINRPLHITPRYVVGLSPARELPIIGRIALGSLKNKLVVEPAMRASDFAAIGQALQGLFDGVRCCDIQEIGARPNSGRRGTGDPFVNAFQSVRCGIRHGYPTL